MAVPDEVKKDRLTQEYRANVTHREIAVGFALDKDKNLAPDEAGAMYGGVYSFLPLGEAKSGAKFPIQADFLLQPGRDALNYEAKWNHWILEEVMKLSLYAISFFKTHDTWKYQFLPAFEFIHSEGLESFEKLFYPRLIKPIENYLAETECVLTVDNQWAKLSDVVRLAEKDTALDDLVRLQLFTKEEIAPAFGQKEGLKLTQQGVTNAANLSFFLVNLSQALLKDKSRTTSLVGILDLKSYFRGLKYVKETMKLSAASCGVSRGMKSFASLVNYHPPAKEAFTQLAAGN